MTKREAKTLAHGIYRILWKSGGESIAAVGALHDGSHWFAPTNWTASGAASIASTKWSMIEQVIKLEV